MGNKNKKNSGKNTYVTKSNAVKKATNGNAAQLRGAKTKVTYYDEMTSGNIKPVEASSVKAAKNQEKKTSAPKISTKRKVGETVSGHVKWFDIKRGYGFIIDADGNDVFVHFSNISDGRTYIGLDKNDKVSFEIVEGANGAEAGKVVISDK